MDTCVEKRRLELTETEAYLSRRYDRQRELRQLIRTHEANCKICNAIKNGLGLAGGLFGMVRLVDEVSNEI